MSSSISPETAQAIAQEAYIYGFPMVMNYKTLYNYTIDPQSPDYKGPFNQLACVTRLFTPDDKAVVPPNANTPYCMFWMDLRAEPLVLSVPEMEPERFYHFQLIDLYTHNFAQGAQGRWLTGDHTFKIHLPKDIPAANFWSLAVYDNYSRSLIQNDEGIASLGSIRGAVPNPDGSVDAYFGPACPTGVPKENWIQTKPGVGYFVYLRLYGPLQPWFDKTWRPGDPELVK